MKYEEWKWNDNLITNQSMIDYQHKTLFNVINDLIRAANESGEPNGLMVEVALDELLKYAGYHFREEEGLMREHSYSDLEAHLEQHQNFVKVMGTFKARFDKNENISHELITFMQKWLVDHIMTRDKRAMLECV